MKCITFQYCSSILKQKKPLSQVKVILCIERPKINKVNDNDMPSEACKETALNPHLAKRLENHLSVGGLLFRLFNKIKKAGKNKFPVR